MEITYKDYVITPDEYQYTLRKKGIIQSGKKKGEDTTYDIGYYHHISSVIHKIIRLEMIKSEERMTLEAYIKRHEAAYTKIEQELQRFKLEE